MKGLRLAVTFVGFPFNPSFTYKWYIERIRQYWWCCGWHLELVVGVLQWPLYLLQILLFPWVSLIVKLQEMIDALYSCWAFNNVDFAADLQYSVSIDFLQNIFKVHCLIGFSPQDMRRLLNHFWSTFSWCYCGTSIHFPDASIFFFFL